MYQDKVLAAQKANAATDRIATDFDIAQDVFQTANSLANRCIALADALMGSVPQPGEAGSLVGADPQGVVPRLGEAAHSTRMRLQEAFEALSRIERGTGVV